MVKLNIYIRKNGIYDIVLPNYIFENDTLSKIQMPFVTTQYIAIAVDDSTIKYTYLNNTVDVFKLMNYDEVYEHLYQI